MGVVFVDNLLNVLVSLLLEKVHDFVELLFCWMFLLWYFGRRRWHRQPWGWGCIGSRQGRWRRRCCNLLCRSTFLAALGLALSLAFLLRLLTCSPSRGLSLTSPRTLMSRLHPSAARPRSCTVVLFVATVVVRIAFPRLGWIGGTILPSLTT